MRLTIVQYGGDYAEAFGRFATGGKAVYQAQRYSVDFVGRLSQRIGQVTVVCLTGERSTDTVLANGVRAINAGFSDAIDIARLIEIVADTRPDRLCVMTPLAGLIRWATRRRLPTIVQLADSFGAKAWRDRLRNWRLARLLAHRHVEWVGNHGLNACLSLLAIGVSPAKIIPWDWPPSFSPHDREPRTRGPGPAKLIFVGAVSEAKGVGDLLEAAAILHRAGLPVEVTVYGPLVDAHLPERARALGLGESARFAGMVANEDVPDAMAAADYVVVPSRHEYPEGLPLTIYEALASRTPLIASDHPMFRGALVDGRSACIFAASAPSSLADAVAGLEAAPEQYAALSRGGAAAWDGLQLPVSYGALIERWIDGDTAWLADHAVASGRYDEPLAQRRAALSGKGTSGDT